MREEVMVEALFFENTSEILRIDGEFAN